MSWLIYLESVKKTPAITRTVELLDSYFNGESSMITSGWRAPMDQVRIIVEKAKKHGIDKEFPEFSVVKEPEVMDLIMDKPRYWWQRTWSRLLHLQDIVNPPIPAELLEDYWNPLNPNHNKKGEIIQVSNHQRGLSFDIGGEDNLIEKSKRVMKANQAGGCFIVSYLTERINNAVHVDVQQIG